MQAGYAWKNETPYIRVWDDTITFQSRSFLHLIAVRLLTKRLSADTWHGSVNQESMSVITLTDATSFDGRGYTNYGEELRARPFLLAALNHSRALYRVRIRSWSGRTHHLGDEPDRDVAAQRERDGS